MCAPTLKKDLNKGNKYLAVNTEVYPHTGGIVYIKNIAITRRRAGKG